MLQSTPTLKPVTPLLSTSDFFLELLFKAELPQDKPSRLISIKKNRDMTLFINKSANAMNEQFLFKVRPDVSHFKKRKAYHGHNSEMSLGTELKSFVKKFQSSA